MRTTALGLLLALSPVFAQQPAPSVVTGVGYSRPSAVKVAPGQIITLFVRTAQRFEQPRIASSGSPLPLSLEGISVALQQTFAEKPIPVPILSLKPVQYCAAVRDVICAFNTAITVQIPFELIPNVSDSRLLENFATLTVTENEVSGDPIMLDAGNDRVHVLNSCDISYERTEGNCTPVIKHADGTLVTSDKPAHADEVLTLQAYGLGKPGAPVSTGSVSPSPAIPVPDVTIAFRFGTTPAIVRPAKDSAPLSAGLAPGSVGLYEITFRVPGLPGGTPACSSITTNVTVSVGRGASFDGAGFCVE